MESKDITLAGAYDRNCVALLHMLRSFEHYKVEQKELETHIQYLEDTHKDTTAKEAELANLIASKELLKKSKNCVELRLWSKHKIEIGDIIRGTFLRNRFEVAKIISRKNHSGTFDTYDDAVNTFYIVHAKPIM